MSTFRQLTMPSKENTAVDHTTAIQEPSAQIDESKQGLDEEQNVTVIGNRQEVAPWSWYTTFACLFLKGLLYGTHEVFHLPSALPSL